MTEEQLVAMRAEIASALNALDNRRPKPTMNPLIVASLVVAMLAPLGGGVAWLMTLSARVAVLESQSQGLTNAAVQISALKQELTDFRGEFRDWKHDNQRDNRDSVDHVDKGGKPP